MLRTMKAGVSFFCIFIAACTMPAVVKRYDGPERDKSQIATLINTNRDVRLVTFDGTTLVDWASTWNPDKWKELQIEPGVHEITGDVGSRYGYGSFTESHDFKAGKTYRFSLLLAPDERKFRVFIVETHGQ